MTIYEQPKPRKRIQDRKFVEWLSEKDCIYCGERASEPHHDRTGYGDGKGSGSRRSDDYRAYRTCPKCHRALHGTDKHRLEWMKDKVSRSDILQDQLDQLIGWIARGMR